MMAYLAKEDIIFFPYFHFQENILSSEDSFEPSTYMVVVHFIYDF